MGYGTFKVGKYFGTDGFRGEANKALTVEHAFKVGRYLGWHYGKEHKCKIVLGKDTRRSSYMLEYALVAGLTASGADAYLLHVTTTPSVSYVVRTEDFDCGIMISASHNPYYDNGIKLINSRGEKMSESIIADIEAYIDGIIGELPFASREDIGCTVDYAVGRNRYTGYIISLARNSYKDFNIGLDCSNGSTWMLAKSIFDALGAHTFVIGNTPTGFNINKDCGSTHIDSLCSLVKEKGLDIGFAFDGDADRCLAVDGDGNIVDGDVLIAIAAMDMKKRGELKNNTAVVTVMTNMGFWKFAAGNGIEVKKTAVGDRYVLEEMLKNDYSIGGEQSGHIIFREFATTGDGELTGVQILAAMKREGKTLRRLAEIMKIYPQTLKNVVVTPEGKAAYADDGEIKSVIESVEKELGGDGRVLVRLSGTEPKIRVMLEGTDLGVIEKLADKIVDKIKERLL